MRIDDIIVLFDHLYWMRDRILEAAQRVPEAFVDASPVTIRDLRATLVHELDVEWSWRERLEQPEPPRAFGPAETELAPADYPTLDTVAEHWQRDESAMRAWLGQLTDADLATPWELESPGGHPLWQHLVHLYTHGVQQLSDAAVILTRAGASPGELDFLEYVQERRVGLDPPGPAAQS
jgi:uncharacterized damage-inducible protein DinB